MKLKHGSMRPATLLGLPLLWALFSIVIPLGVLLAHSFFKVSYPIFKPAFVFDSYATIASDPQYLQVIARTAKISVLTAISTLIVTFPLVYFLVFTVRSKTVRSLLYFMIILPLWVSYLLRAYVWKTILGQEGVLNSVLMYMGITDKPSGLFLYNQIAMVITLTYIFIPFMAMPIYASLERIPIRLIEAAMDLGMTPLQTFWNVTLPLAMPGVVAGVIFTVCLTSGDFVAANLVGGPSGAMVASTIQTQFGASLNWPLGSALSVIMFVAVTLLVAISERFNARDRINLS